MKIIMEFLKTLEYIKEINLNGGISHDLLNKFEMELNTEIPMSFKDYLLLCNGQDERSSIPFLSDMFFLQLADIKELMKINMDLFLDEPKLNWIKENKIKPEMWDANWIPFARNSTCNSYLLLDLAPGKYGTYGQVIYYYPGFDQENGVIASSFDMFLKEVIFRLKNKEYTLEKQEINFNDYYF